VRKLPSFSSILGVVLGLVLVVALVLGWQAQRYGQVAAGYIARQMCACLYVQNRTEASCRAEMPPEINQTQIVYFDEKVIVNFLGLDRAEARLLPGFGCNVQSFAGSMPTGVLEPATND
jgi:hypothetical protein